MALRSQWCFLVLLLSVSSTCPVLSHRILGLFPSPEKSHWAVGEGIVKALCAAGHQVINIIQIHIVILPMIN